MALIDPQRQIAQRPHQIAAHRAAEAAGIQQHGIAIQPLHQQVIEADFAELVDQHGGVAERRVLQQAVQQRGLAGAEEAGEHRDRDRRGRARGRAHRPYSTSGATSGAAISARRPSRSAW